MSNWQVEVQGHMKFRHPMASHLPKCCVKQLGLYGQDAETSGKGRGALGADGGGTTGTQRRDRRVSNKRHSNDLNRHIDRYRYNI